MAEEIHLPSCNVCSKEIRNYDGLISFNEWNRVARSLVDEVLGFDNLSDRNREFVNATTWQYLKQFPDEYARDYGFTGVSFGELWTDFQIDGGAVKDRYERTVNKNPIRDKKLALVVHNSCQLGGYFSTDLELDRITTPDRAIEWLKHLNGKPWFNHYGFVEVLHNLFRTKGV